MRDATDMTEPQSLMTTSSHSALIATMTPAERAAGRFMRAPDHGDGDPPPADPPPADPEPSDPPEAPPADPAGDPADPPDPDDKSLMGKAGAKEGDEKPDGPQLPEKYEITPPEGFKVDDDLLAEVDPVFRELGLNNEQANKLMPLAGKFAERIAAGQADAFQSMKTDWAREAKADSEIGGRNWTETESYVAKALDQFGAPKAFRDMLDETGLGNHPEMIRMFRRVGAQLGEGGEFVRADGGAPVKQDRLATLYPNDVPKEAAQ